MKHSAFDTDMRIVRATEPNPGSILPVDNSLELANQRTLPTRPLQDSFPRAELGDSGTRLLHGIITEEYNPQLQGIQGIRVYDEMRKSDGTVRAAVLVCTLPIRRAQWFVNPATDEQQDKDIANFIEHALFDWMDINWDDVVRQALLMVAFGVMVFEKVYGIKQHEGKDWVTISKMAPRLPKSILQWELPDRTFGIQQIRQDGILAMIPGSKLLVFVNEREGDNWWGTSMLRAAYKHWYYKNNFYKIDAVAFERQGIGVPKITMPAGYTEADEKKAQQAAQNLRASESAFLLLPPNYTAEFMDMGGGKTRDPHSSISHHDKAILQSVLAQFLELGQGGSNSGSRALSTDHSDLFLKAEESLANTLIGVINKDLIPELVDLNFQNVKVYPKLDYSGISKVDVTALSTAYASLVTSGAITPTADDQQYLRAAMGLPPRTQADIDAETEGDPSTEDQIDHANIEDNGEPDPTGQNKDDAGKVDDAAGGAKKPKQTTAQNKKTDKASKNVKEKAHDHGKKIPRKFDDGNGFMSWRPLTFAEQKVSWKNIEDKINEIESSFAVQANALLSDAKDAFMAKLHAAFEVGDQKAIADLEIKFVSDYKALLKSTMTDAYEYGKTSVSSEMGIAYPPNNAETLANINLMAGTIAEKTASDLTAKAKSLAVNHLNQDTSVYMATGDIDGTLDDGIASAVDATSSLVVGQSINMGRNDVFQRNADDIHGLQRSEILDEKTCDFCLSMDGLVVDTGSKWANTDVFHSSCRGIWVEILKDEQNPPDITDVPEEIAKYWGGTPNSLIQPRSPIVRPDSPAADEAQRRKDAKKK